MHRGVVAYKHVAVSDAQREETRVWMLSNGACVRVIAPRLLRPPILFLLQVPLAACIRVGNLLGEGKGTEARFCAKTAWFLTFFGGKTIAAFECTKATCRSACCAAPYD